MSQVEKRIRIRASVVLIENDKILLVPQFYPDEPTKWVLPGGRVEYGETLKSAAEREMQEETGLIVSCVERLDIFELIEPAVPNHSIAAVFRGRLIGGEVTAEDHPIYGKKAPQWFTVDELQAVRYHPELMINKFFRLRL